MEPEGSLPYSQVPATCPYPGPTPSSPHHRLQLPEDPLYIILPSTSGSPQMALSPQASPPTPCALLSPRHMPRPSTRTILGKEYRSFSSSLCNFLHSPVTSSLLGPNTVRTSYSQTSSAYVPPSVSAIKFHTHTKQRAKL
jgi:hypothetical protein